MSDPIEKAEELQKKAEKAFSIWGTFTKGLGLLWDGIWTFGIFALIAWAAKTSGLDGGLVDKGLAWLGSQNWGKELINLIGGFMEMLGFEHPLKSATEADLAKGLEGENATPEEKAHAEKIAKILQPYWGKKDGMVDKGLLSLEKIVTPEGVKNLLKIVSQEDMQKLLEVLGSAPATNDEKKKEANEKLQKDFLASLQKINDSQTKEDKEFKKWMKGNRPEIYDAFFKETRTTQVNAIPATPPTPAQTPTGITPPGTQGTTPPASAPATPTPAPIIPIVQNKSYPAYTPEQIQAALSNNKISGPTVEAAKKLDPSLAGKATPAPASDNSIYSQLMNVEKNKKALDAAIAAAPESQKQAVMATIASVTSGKFDLANKDELVKFFANEQQRKAVTDFIINLDVSTITDERTKKLLAAVQKAAPALGTVLADKSNIEYLLLPKERQTALAKIAFGYRIGLSNSKLMEQFEKDLKEYEKTAPTPAATPAPAANPPAETPQKRSAIIPDAGLAAAVQQASLLGNTPKNITVVDVTNVDPRAAQMIVAAAQGNSAQAVG